MDDEYDLEEHDHDLVDFDASDYELSDLEEDEEESFSRKKSDADEVGDRSNLSGNKTADALTAPASGTEPKKWSKTGPGSCELEEGEYDGPSNDVKGDNLSERPEASQPLPSYKVVVPASFFSEYCLGQMIVSDSRLVTIGPG